MKDATFPLLIIILGIQFFVLGIDIEKKTMKDFGLAFTLCGWVIFIMFATCGRAY